MSEKQILRHGLNGNQLKLIAVVSMLCDHAAIRLLAYGLIPALRETGADAAADLWNQVFWILRSVGRMAFPIYVFLLVEGFCHTANRRRYAMRLGIFALLSEVPYDLLLFGKPWDMRAQNVFITLFLGILMLTVIDWIGKNTEAGMAPYRQMGVIAATAFLACFLKCDYDAVGIMLIALFFWLRPQPGTACLLGLLFLAAAESKPVYLPGLAAAFCLIRCYNGTRGGFRGKWFFYLVYPVHLLLLYGLSRLLFG
ncbi:hypothetical protein DXB18_14865 [Clostridium sp. OM02-18AC]|uniref:TraX family protein n=1 Tax=Clostridium sp. OM02-18AC TaxID=2292311 RepID=UPI000E479E4A|nr:TraX family protein [Clostridium sp. OM02-18AC]RHV62972.1 hypothetical protein DXB18_14865 [Clostridium sp. OM02-18AC]